MYIPVPNPNWKHGDPGTGFPDESKTLVTRIIRKNNGSVNTSTAFTKVMTARQQRSESVNGSIVSMSPGKRWKKATNFFRIAAQVTWAGPGFWTDETLSSRYEMSGFRNSGYAEFMQDGWPARFNGGGVSFSSMMRIRAQQEAMAKLNSNGTHFMTALVEARKSHSMLVSRFTDVLTALRDVRRGRLRKGSLSDASGTWLEIQYGWKPLLNDLYHAVPTFKSAMSPPLLVRAERHVVERGGGPLPSKGYHEQTSGSWTERHGCKLVAQLDDKYKYAAQGLGLNPLTAAWELVPWSFVIDWVAPVGTVLENLTASGGLRFFDGYSYRLYEGECEGRRLPSSSWTEVRPQSYRCVAGEFRRERLTSFPRPAFYLKSPFSSKRAINAIALWHQLKQRR